MSSLAHSPAKAEAFVARVHAPNRTVIGEIIQEAEERVFVRKVQERNRFRKYDAWTLGAHVLEQLRAWHVTRLRYVHGDAIYEEPLDEFLAKAISLYFLPERQLALPRIDWSTRPGKLHDEALRAVALRQAGLS